MTIRSQHRSNGTNDPQERQTTIAIVGGGFVGLLTARRLARRIGRNARVILMDPKDHFLFSPRLIDLLADRTLPPSLWKSSYRAAADRDTFQFLHGSVTHVDRHTRTLTFRPHGALPATSLTYDRLILCPGSTTCFYNIPGAKQHAFALKTHEDLERLQEALANLLQRAHEARRDVEKRKLLSLVIVGAGPTGIESAFAMQMFIHRWCERHDRSLSDLASYSLIQAAPQILPGFSDRLVDGAIHELQHSGIREYVGEGVTRVTEDAVETTVERTIPAGLVFWAAGIEANQMTCCPNFHRDARGCITVDRCLRIDDHTFGGGDAVFYQEHNQIIPKNAQTALLMARTLEENVLRSLMHRPLLPFHYRSKGNIIVTGDTGFLELPFLTIKTRWAPFLRDLFYRYRMWQVSQG